MSNFPAPPKILSVDNPQYQKRLKEGGDDVTFDVMEQRVTRLENKVDKVEERLTSIEVTLARIEEKLDGKPGHWAVLGLNATLLGLVLAAIGFGARIL